MGCNPPDDAASPSSDALGHRHPDGPAVELTAIIHPKRKRRHEKPPVTKRARDVRGEELANDLNRRRCKSDGTLPSTKCRGRPRCRRSIPYVTSHHSSSSCGRGANQTDFLWALWAARVPFPFSSFSLSPLALIAPVLVRGRSSSFLSPKWISRESRYPDVASLFVCFFPEPDRIRFLINF